MKCAVLGDPIGHSLSPALHRAGYVATGLDWTYDALQVASGGLASFVAGLGGSWRGLSLTMPLKREAMPLLDRVSDLGLMAGAVNTLLLVDGEVRGDNTDIPGAVAALRERTDQTFDRACIWGGGATASSTLLALADLGCVEFTLQVRNPETATETLAAASRHPAGPQVSVGALGDPVAADVLVSTIPASAQTPLLVAACHQVPVVFEVLYDPWPTPLAASVGADRVLVSGHDLLVHQAALQFSAFTGLPAPLAAMRAALSERA